MVSNNGNKNTKFGVYKTVCCGYEIVIGAGITFPDCPKHLKLPTEWKLVLEAEDQVLHVDDIKERKKPYSRLMKILVVDDERKSCRYLSTTFLRGATRFSGLLVGRT